MDLIKQSQYPDYNQRKEIYNKYFGTATNTKQSLLDKLTIIHLICFLTSVMCSKMPEKYTNVKDVMEAVLDMHLDETQEAGLHRDILAFCILCEDLMWQYSSDNIPKPEGFTKASEIKDRIVNYFTEEWMPF